MKMKQTMIVFFLAFSIFLVPMMVFADTNHNGADWNITTDTSISGYHYNIGSFFVAQGVQVNVSPINSSNGTGWLKINATNVYVYGSIVADGTIGGGGGGGGGASNYAYYYGQWYRGYGGLGGMAQQLGANGGHGGAWDSCTNGDYGGYGAAGGNGSNGIAGGSGGPCGSSTTGNSGKNASNISDTTASLNFTYGNGGGGGGGGGGNKRDASCAPSDGGAGGGAGQDGGGAIVLIAKKAFVANGTITARAGQNACPNRNGTYTNGYEGGAGGSTNESNCQLGVPPIPYSRAHVDPCMNPSRPGGPGGVGGYGSGGMIVLAGAVINLLNASLNVSGGINNGGTIKVLYAYTLQNNGSYSGQSALVVSKINDTWFELPQDEENAARAAVLQGVSSSIIGSNYTYFTDHLLAIRLSNGTQYSGRFDIFLKSGNKRWAFNYDPGNISALITFANITPVFYAWQKINMTPGNITNDVSGFMNSTS